MATGRTTNARLINGIDVDTIMASGEWNKLVNGLDLQTWALGRYVGGSGLVTGGTILTSKEVGPTRAFVDGFMGVTAANQAISGLVNNKVNSVWCLRVDPPTSGPNEDDPDYATTFNTGALAFYAQDTQPAHSFYLGTITLNSGGTATAVDNEEVDRPTVLPLVTQRWIGTVTTTGLAEGDSIWVEVDHSADVTFRAVLLLEYASLYPPNDTLGGFEIQQIENCRGDKFGFMLYNVGSYGQTYYGETTCTVVFTRTGIV